MADLFYMRSFINDFPITYQSKLLANFNQKQIEISADSLLFEMAFPERKVSQ